MNWRNFRPAIRAKEGQEEWPKARVFPQKTNRPRTFFSKVARSKPSSAWLFKNTYPERRLRHIAKGNKPWSLSEEEYRHIKHNKVVVPMAERQDSVFRLMRQVRWEELQRMEKHVLTDRHIDPGFKAGDRLQITKYVNLGDHSKYETIKGFCLARKDIGLDSHFTIINNKDETSFEMKVPLFSPWVKDVKILQKGNIKTQSCWHMRDRPVAEFQT